VIGNAVRWAAPTEGSDAVWGEVDPANRDD
jgi:hypothetical protein